MTEEVKNFIDNLGNGSNNEAGEAFKDALRDKVASGLDNKRKEMAAQMFNKSIETPTEAEPFSDPKPEVADPGTFGKDGIVNPLSKDGEAQIDLTTDENK